MDVGKWSGTVVEWETDGGRKHWRAAVDRPGNPYGGMVFEYGIPVIAYSEGSVPFGPDEVRVRRELAAALLAGLEEES